MKKWITVIIIMFVIAGGVNWFSQRQVTKKIPAL